MTAKEYISELITVILVAYYTSCWWIIFNREIILVENKILEGLILIVMIISLAVGTASIISFAAAALFQIYDELD